MYAPSLWANAVRIGLTSPQCTVPSQLRFPLLRKTASCPTNSLKSAGNCRVLPRNRDKLGRYGHLSWITYNSVTIKRLRIAYFPRFQHYQWASRSWRYDLTVPNVYFLHEIWRFDQNWYYYNHPFPLSATIMAELLKLYCITQHTLLAERSNLSPSSA